MDKIITGALLRKMVVSGANYLEENKEYVNSLNVFPVPDGDTGTNMSLTMKSAVKELNMCTNNDMETICDAISKGALKGARGNSGVILSQILKGITATWCGFTIMGGGLPWRLITAWETAPAACAC